MVLPPKLAITTVSFAVNSESSQINASHAGILQANTDNQAAGGVSYTRSPSLPNRSSSVKPTWTECHLGGKYQKTGCIPAKAKSAGGRYDRILHRYPLKTV